jgi:hydrogenase expression/formation protein HypE
VTGDTKVVGRGAADGLFVNTTGIGLVPPGRVLGTARVRSGDAVLLSGPIGDHGATIMATRIGFDSELRSDTAALHRMVEALLEACPDVHALRDPTRGGVAATLVEIATRRNLGIEVDEAAVPMRDAVRGACELLGLEPLLVANEGKLIAFVPAAQAERALAAMRADPLGRGAARIGTVVDAHPGTVELTTLVRGRRILDLPYAEPLPRIC